MDHDFDMEEFFAEFALTIKQMLFVVGLFRYEHKIESARQAGYAESSAHVEANRLLRNAKVLKAVEKYRAHLEKIAESKFNVTNERLIAEYARIAFLDPREFYDKNGNLKNVTQLDENVARTIAGLDVTRRSIVSNKVVEVSEKTSKVKVSSKISALDSLARIKGLFEKDNEQRRKKKKTLKLTVYPSEPENLAEWERHVIKAEKENAELLEEHQDGDIIDIPGG